MAVGYHYRLLILGILLYIPSDLVYDARLFAGTYRPYTLRDGAYTTAVLLFAFAGIKEISNPAGRVRYRAARYPISEPHQSTHPSTASRPPSGVRGAWGQGLGSPLLGGRHRNVLHRARLTPDP